MNPLQQAREEYQNGYYADKLQQGLEYQDFVTDELYKRGIIVVGYASRKYQNKKGENKFGAEIKRDGKFRETGNLYIEIAEKAHPDNGSYANSGIQRRDNSWLFVIGDEQTIYVFSLKFLRALLLARSYKKVTKPTSIGYLMPVSEAEKYCIRKIETGKDTP